MTDYEKSIVDSHKFWFVDQESRYLNGYAKYCDICGIRYNTFLDTFYEKRDNRYWNISPISCQEYIMKQALG